MIARFGANIFFVTTTPTTIAANTAHAMIAATTPIVAVESCDAEGATPFGVRVVVSFGSSASPDPDESSSSPEPEPDKSSTIVVVVDAAPVDELVWPLSTVEGVD